MDAAVTAALDALTEVDALTAIGRLRSRHGLAVLVMTRADAASVWHRDADVGDSDPTITDEQWDAIQSTWSWRKGFSDEPLMGLAWALVTDAVEDAKRAATQQ